MSDENVGGLVEKWRMSSVVNMATASIEEIKRATTLTCCANELEAALSAHGQPVVDAELMKRVLGAPYDGVTVGDFFVYADFSEHDTLGVVRAIVDAALGATP